MSGGITLYTYRRCPFAIRVRLTLHEKGLKFLTIEEDLKSMSEGLKRLHPEGKVPLLLDGDTVVYESCIITEYLNDRYPQVDLMPSDAIGRMQVREWTYWCDTFFKPQIDRFKYGAVRLTAKEVDDAANLLIKAVKRMEQVLSKSDWLVGDHFSLADIHVFPFYRQLSKVTPSHPRLVDFPKTLAWYERITERPAFEKTMRKSN